MERDYGHIRICRAGGTVMNRQEYLDEIKEKLLGLSEEDIDKALEFYMEALDDRIDDGLTEEQAINAVGTADEVAEQILMDTPLPKLVSATVKPKRDMKAWEIVLLILGAPLWIPLLIALFSIAFSSVKTRFSVSFPPACRRNSVGVTPCAFLNTLLKRAAEVKPQS